MCMAVCVTTIRLLVAIFVMVVVGLDFGFDFGFGLVMDEIVGQGSQPRGCLAQWHQSLGLK